MRAIHLFSFAAAALSNAYAQNVVFFYTQTLDTCSIHGNSMPADQETSHGGVCAYRSDVDRVYACPAPDPTCWTWAQNCNDNTVGQVVCNRGGTVFCCNAVAGESCTTTSGQINVCISNFTSPNSGVSIAKANQTYLSAIGVSNVTATKQTSDPTPFSTRQLAATASSSIDSSSGTKTATKTAPGNSSPTSSTTSTGKASSTQIPATSPVSSGVSSGAIAGIVVGAVAGVALVGAAFFLLGKRKRNQRNAADDSREPLSSQPGHSAYGNNNEKNNLGGFYGGQGVVPSVSELGQEGNGRAEMPTTNTAVHADSNQRYEMP